jgi:hypothetical protein
MDGWMDEKKMGVCFYLFVCAKVVGLTEEAMMVHHR